MIDPFVLAGVAVVHLCRQILQLVQIRVLFVSSYTRELHLIILLTLILLLQIIGPDLLGDVDQEVGLALKVLVPVLSLVLLLYPIISILVLTIPILSISV